MNIHATLEVFPTTIYILFRNPTYFYKYTKNGAETTKSCLSEGGVPMQPYWILGGFIPEDTKGFPENPRYEHSTAVVVNIIVNNFDSKSEDPKIKASLARAKAWEAVYIDFMKTWTANESNTMYMDVAFTSERSIEDELLRETYEDIGTIALSYILMFVYITIALGRITRCRRFVVSKIFIKTFSNP